MRQFESFGYRAVIITKLDETMRLENMLFAFAMTGEPFACFTDGQPSASKYIQRMSILSLLANLNEFMLDRERLEAYFTYGRQCGLHDSQGIQRSFRPRCISPSL
jgi:flagellar biosynthesis protein FlhF